MKKCKDCKNKNFCNETSRLYGVPQYQGGCKHWKDKNELTHICDEHTQGKETQTNADRIRRMSDEELAEWLHNISHDNEAEEPNVCIYDLDNEKEIELYDSYGDLLEWLQSEAEITEQLKGGAE